MVMKPKQKQRQQQKGQIETIALERIERLFSLADEAFATHPERSDRYVQLALKIGTRNRVRIPRELKTKYCKKCHAFLQKGKNAEIAEKTGFFEIRCLKCQTRFLRQKSAL